MKIIVFTVFLTFIGHGPSALAADGNQKPKTGRARLKCMMRRAIAEAAVESRQYAGSWWEHKWLGGRVPSYIGRFFVKKYRPWKKPEMKLSGLFVKNEVSSIQKSLEKGKVPKEWKLDLIRFNDEFFYKRPARFISNHLYSGVRGADRQIYETTIAGDIAVGGFIYFPLTLYGAKQLGTLVGKNENKKKEREALTRFQYDPLFEDLAFEYEYLEEFDDDLAIKSSALIKQIEKYRKMDIYQKVDEYNLRLKKYEEEEKSGELNREKEFLLYYEKQEEEYKQNVALRNQLIKKNADKFLLEKVKIYQIDDEFINFIKVNLRESELEFALSKMKEARDAYSKVYSILISETVDFSQEGFEKLNHKHSSVVFQDSVDFEGLVLKRPLPEKYSNPEKKEVVQMDSNIEINKTLDELNFEIDNFRKYRELMQSKYFEVDEKMNAMEKDWILNDDELVEVKNLGIFDVDYLLRLGSEGLTEEEKKNYQVANTEKKISVNEFLKIVDQSLRNFSRNQEMTDFFINEMDNPTASQYGTFRDEEALQRIKRNPFHHKILSAYESTKLTAKEAIALIQLEQHMSLQFYIQQDIMRMQHKDESSPYYSLENFQKFLIQEYSL